MVSATCLMMLCTALDLLNCCIHTTQHAPHVAVSSGPHSEQEHIPFGTYARSAAQGRLIQSRAPVDSVVTTTCSTHLLRFGDVLRGDTALGQIDVAGKGNSSEAHRGAVRADGSNRTRLQGDTAGDCYAPLLFVHAQDDDDFLPANSDQLVN